jgi:ABC-type antimicrobial peptide transport system permease subunit
MYKHLFFGGVGAIVGAVLGAWGMYHTVSNDPDTDNRSFAVVFAFAGAIGGAMLGALIGVII